MLDTLLINRWPLKNASMMSLQLWGTTSVKVPSASAITIFSKVSMYLQFWATWTILASSFLAATLMFFRATGCRVVRRFEPDSITGRVMSSMLPKRIAIRAATADR